MDELFKEWTKTDAKISDRGVFAGIYIRELELPRAGDYHPGHQHILDHVTILTRGSIKIDVDGHSKTFTAPAWITIQKDTWHKITAVSDDVHYMCVFRQPELTPDGDAYTIDNSPYLHRGDEKALQKHLLRLQTMACPGCAVGCDGK